MFSHYTVDCLTRQAESSYLIVRYEKRSHTKIKGGLYMCNNNFDFNSDFGFRNSSRCGCNCGCGRNSWNRCNDFDSHCDNNALLEAEFVARQALRRRQRENRCAREFVRCMRNARCE